MLPWNPTAKIKQMKAGISQARPLAAPQIAGTQAPAGAPAVNVQPSLGIAPDGAGYSGGQATRTTGPAGPSMPPASPAPTIQQKMMAAKAKAGDVINKVGTSMYGNTFDNSYAQKLNPSIAPSPGAPTARTPEQTAGIRERIANDRARVGGVMDNVGKRMYGDQYTGQMENRFRPLPQGGGTGQPNPVADPAPANDLRTDVYTPGNDPRLQGAQGATDAAGNAIQSGPNYSTMAQGAEGRYRGLFGTGQVDSLSMDGAPNRTELAKTALSDFDAQDLERRKDAYRSLTQNSAGRGRLGMMDEARKVLDTERRFDQDRMRFSNELARDVSEGDIGDRFRTIDYKTGLAERNQDRGFDRSLAATDYGGRDAMSDLDDRYDRYSAAGSLEDRIYGQGRGNRDEFRGERGFQVGEEQRRFNNRLNQRRQEGDELDQRIRQALLQSQYGGG